MCAVETTPSKDVVNDGTVDDDDDAADNEEGVADDNTEDTDDTSDDVMLPPTLNEFRKLLEVTLH